MTSHQHDDSSADEATSSLGDSTYDFIDDRSVVTTDDESQDGTTESTTSSDDFEADYSYHGRPEVHNRSHAGSNHSSRRRSTVQSPPTPILSAQSRCPHAEGPRGSGDEPIIFEEPSVVDLSSARLAEVQYELGTISRNEGLPTSLPTNDLVVSVQQTMTTHELELKGKSYKVFLVGDSEYKDSILQKIATSLASSSHKRRPGSGSPLASKFNVVPISSFGDETAPEVVLIDSSGLEMEVEQCTSAIVLQAQRDSDTIQLSFADETAVISQKKGSDFIVSADWRLPDLALFCIADADSLEAKRTRCCARTFMTRHSVPSIIITTTGKWTKSCETMTLDYLTPHICLQDCTRLGDGSQVVKRLPIDLRTFLKIDPGQMNRNLACLSDAQKHYSRTRDDPSSEYGISDQVEIKSPFAGSFTRILRRCPEWVQTYHDLIQQSISTPLAWTILGVLLISVCLARCTSPTASQHPLNSSTILPTSATAAAPLMPSTKNVATTVSPFTPILSHTSSTRTVTSPIRSLSTDTDITAFLLRQSAERSIKVEENFQVHVLGDCHIVARLPEWFMRLKRAPSLSFNLARKNSPLEHKVSMLFDGVYALHVAREEAYGMLQVTIRTTTQPDVDETFEVDFGSSWLKIAAWKRATRALSESVQSELNQMQTSLGMIYDKSRSEFATLVQKQKAKIVRKRKVDKEVFARRLKQGVRTRALVAAQTKDLTRVLNCKLRQGLYAATKQLQSLGTGLNGGLTRFTRSKAIQLSRQAANFGKANSGIDIGALSNELRNLRRWSLRNAQKAALKSWWKINGLPKKRVDATAGDGRRVRDRLTSRGHL